MKAKMDVTITIHNPTQIHVDCIKSLLHNRSYVGNIVIIDNASGHSEFVDEIAMMANIYHRLEKQVSIGESWNIGIELTQSRYVLVCNDDILFTKNWCIPLIETIFLQTSA